MDILSYSFMQRAFIAGIMLAIITPCIGVTIVLKRMSMIGDALSHSSLSGVAIGLLLGVNPVLAASAICVLAALGIEGIRRKLPRYSEVAIAIVMSAGIGLAGVLSGYISNTANFNSFLFGSIVAISQEEIIIISLISVIVFLAIILLYKELFYIAFDESAARIAGVPVQTINFIFTVLVALTVSIAARTVGALIVSSMLVVPVACGMQLGKSYRNVLLWAIVIAIATTIVGLVLSFYTGVKPGGTIVLLEVILFLIVVLSKSFTKKITNHP